MDAGQPSNSFDTGNKRIDESIAGVAAIADRIPAVITIHLLPEFKLLYMSQMGLSLLKQPWSEMRGMSSEEYNRRFFNPQDTQEYVPRILALLESNTDDTVTFFQQVKTSNDGDWEWYMSSIRILTRDENSQPLLSINVSQKVDPQNPFATKAVRLLAEKEFIRNHFTKFASLGKREIDVLRLLALGKSASEIAEELHISIATAETHRKNIRKKINAANSYDLSQFAMAFDLI